MRARHWIRKKKKPRLDWLMSNSCSPRVEGHTPCSFPSLQWANGCGSSEPSSARAPAGQLRLSTISVDTRCHNPSRCFAGAKGEAWEGVRGGFNDPSSAFNQQWCSMVAFFVSFKFPFFPSFLHFGYEVITTRRSE